MMQRRALLALPALSALPALPVLPALAAPARPDPALAQAAALLRGGGVVAAFRHASAPGTFDPPGFRLGDCSTQRNLDDAGRAQARRLGAWFQAQGLRPAAVRSSPWCRCIDSATLAFGRADHWAALSSPRGPSSSGAGSESAGAEHLQQLREALLAARSRSGFEAWVTHQFVLNDLVGSSTASGEGLVLQADAQGLPRVLARIVVA